MQATQWNVMTLNKILHKRQGQHMKSYSLLILSQVRVIRNRIQVFKVDSTRGSAIAEEPRDALRQLKYYGRFLTELLTRSSANPDEPCEHTVS